MNRPMMINVLAVALLACGCATEPAPAPRDTVAQQVAEIDWSRYRSAVVEPVLFRASVPTHAPALADSFRTAFVAPLTEASLLASANARGVLRVRIVVTDVNRSRPLLNVATSALLFVPLDSGGASVEMELRDGESGELKATLIRHSMGTPLKIKGSFSEYGHATAAFRLWGEELREHLTHERIG
jgi:hypothetical protein